MAFREIIELPRAQIEIEERTGYLFVVESGRLRTVEEAQKYTQRLTRAAKQSGCNGALIDARGELGEPIEEVRAAVLKWALSGRSGFELVALVLANEIAITRVNMTAISKGAPLRAFASVTAARRWVVRGPRASTATTLDAIEAARDMRAARKRAEPLESDVMRPAVGRESPETKSGAYHSSGSPAERVGGRRRNGGEGGAA